MNFIARITKMQWLPLTLGWFVYCGLQLEATKNPFPKVMFYEAGNYNINYTKQQQSWKDYFQTCFIIGWGHNIEGGPEKKTLK